VQKETVLAVWRHCEQLGEARSNEPPVALYTGVRQFVAMVARMRKHGHGMLGVWRAVSVMYG
jgi:hypothetical protein